MALSPFVRDYLVPQAPAVHFDLPQRYNHSSKRIIGSRGSNVVAELIIHSGRCARAATKYNAMAV
jgi:hypothetical protein